MENILELKNVTKVYGPTIALNDVTFSIPKGKITSLVGENGAGKSTLLKILSGVIHYNEYQGTLLLEGKKTQFKGVKSSEKAGIAIIHQELSISPYISICENLFLGDYITKFGVIQWNEMYNKSKKYLEMVGIEEDPSTLAGQLSVAKKQLVEIAKALSKNSKIIILDEPTSSLNDEDSFKLLDIMKDLKSKGVTVLFVSHKLNEVKYVADNIVVIRDGHFISQYNKEESEITEASLIKDIVGRKMESKFPTKDPDRKIGEIMFQIKDIVVPHRSISNYNVVNNATMDARKGEIVGLSGLVGSGRTELILSLFGGYYKSFSSGEFWIKSKKVKYKSPKEAIKDGFMYASEDRKELGLIQLFAINNNISDASLHLLSKYGIRHKNKEYKNSLELKEKVKIKTKNIDNPVNSLSGGNQQKVVIAKALTTQFDILVIDEPTKGIDVGSKFEIYNLLFELAKEGKCIIIISSEIEELLGTTDRIFVMSQGTIKGQIKTSEATSEKIMKLSIGKENNQ